MTTGILKSLLGKKDERMAEAAPEAVAPIHLTEATFEQAIRSDLPVLVDFWAPWCGPCLMMGPAVDELAREYDGRVVVAKMNADENGDLLDRLGVSGIPMFIVFKDGREIGRHLGYAPRHVLRAKLESALNNGG